MSSENNQMPQNDDLFWQTADRKLQQLDLEYQQCIAQDNKLNNIDLPQLNGIFEFESFQNVQFKNDENDIQNNDNDQDDLSSDDNQNHGYQNIQDDYHSDNDEEWGTMETAEILEPEPIQQNNLKQLDIDTIKNIMSKIQIKPPSWANEEDIWKDKIKNMIQKDQ